MKQTYIGFPKQEWGIAVVFDFDVDAEYDVLFEQMRSFGLSERNIRKSLDILSNYNTGMAVANDTLKMSAIYISNATSPSQWWDSALHELTHVTASIIRHYGVGYDTEETAYLVGYLTKELVELLGEPCRN